MIAAFCQFNICFGAKARNLARAVAMLEPADVDLIVLPELFTTGYLFSSKDEAARLAEPVPDGPATRALIALAVRKRACIVAGIAESDGPAIYSTAVIAGPSGYVGKHRKVHLSRFEIPLFDRGGVFQTFDLGRYRLGIAPCFDLWFPEACRELACQRADIICSPANFGGPWSVDILKVRAIENAVYAIAANRTGTETRNGITAEFRGESQIVSPTGQVLAHADANDALLTAAIDPAAARTKRNALSDDLFAELAYHRHA